MSNTIGVISVPETLVVQLGTPVALPSRSDRYGLLAAKASLVTFVLQRIGQSRVVATEAGPAIVDYLADRRCLVLRCYSAIDCGRIFELSRTTLSRKVATYAMMVAELAGADLEPSVS